MAKYDLDMCDNERCQFAGVCKRFLPRNQAPKDKYLYYITDCTSYIHFIPK